MSIALALYSQNTTMSVFLKADSVETHLSLNKHFISWSQALGEGLKAQPFHLPRKNLLLK